MPFDSARRLRVRSHLDFCGSASLAQGLGPRPRFQPKGYGAVVDQRHLHVGAENAAFDPRVLGARCGDEPFEQMTPQIRRGRCGKSRPQSVSGVGSESELRHQEEISSDLAEIEIHFAAFVGENAIFQHSVQEFLSRRGIVIRPDADKHQESALDRGDDRPLDPDFGLKNPLKECDHAVNGKGDCFGRITAARKAGPKLSIQRQLLVVSLDELIVLRMQKVMQHEDLLMPFFTHFPMIELVTICYFFISMALIEFHDCSTLTNVLILQYQIRSNDVIEIVEYSWQKMFWCRLEHGQGVS